MAGKGRKFSFHGAFKRKADAKRREKSIGGFIHATLFCKKKKCHRRFLVLKPR
jgi:hypothetical protein